MQKLYVWDKSLTNNYPSQTKPGEMEIGASAVIIAPSIKVAIEQLKKKIVASDKFGPSAHYRRMVEAMKTTKPTKVTPITMPGSDGESGVVFVTIGAHYNDPRSET